MPAFLPSPDGSTDLNKGRMSGLFAPQNVLDTPLENVSCTPSDRASKKRVGFHSTTIDILDVLTPDESDITPSLRSLPRSRDCYMNARPILKTSLSTEYIDTGPCVHFDLSWSAQMESLMTVLQDDDAASSADAYSTMVTLIKTHDEPPDHEVLKTKMLDLQKFVKRDLVVLDGGDGTLDANVKIRLQSLVINTLKILVTIVWHPLYAPCMTEDFRAWTVDRAIKVLDECIASKIVVLHYMHLLATQHYRGSVLQSNNRALRIIEALNKLDNHVTGKAIISERCLIYQRLMDQARATMKTNAGLWVKHLIVAMAHHVKDIRQNAISAGTKACTVFAGSQSIVIATRTALSETNGERTLSVSVTTRLEKVLQTKDDARQIPQIWTIVLIMANNQQNQIDKWPELTDWLRLLQRCFNCSDHAARIEAFTAWNHLYALAQLSSASEKVVSMLPKPAATQLEKSSDQSGRKTRQAAASSYTMLLYYAFRPSFNAKQLTHSWNAYVVKIMTRKFLSKSRPNGDLCCKILASLFFATGPGPYVWKDSRVRDSTQMGPAELPVLDSKWIRSKVQAILGIVRLLIEHSFLTSERDGGPDAHAVVMWRNLLLALKEAGSKEILPTTEFKAAQRTIVDYLNFVKSAGAGQTSAVVQTKLDALMHQVRIVFPALLGDSRLTDTTLVKQSNTMQKQQVGIDEAVQVQMPNQDQAQTEHSSLVELPPTESTKCLPTKMPRPKLTRRARHDDSQTEFVALQSSIQELPDTQLMTTHQRETRDRQRLESALVFADVSSSTLSSKQSGEPLKPIDFTMMEMIQTLRPSTPPLPDRNLERGDEVPSTPTPRTRKVMAAQSAPDVVSSPASILDQESGMKMSEIITSSPIKAQKGDGDVLDLSEARAMEDCRLGEREETPCRKNEQLVNQAFSLLEVPEEQPASDAIIVDTETSHVSITQAPTTDESDEFDALAASQLAESSDGRQLEHVPTKATDDVVVLTPAAKKRKRHDGYAGSDGKRKRKRRSSYKESSQLSQTDSQITDSFNTEQADLDGRENDSDCIIVAPAICQTSFRQPRVRDLGRNDTPTTSTDSLVAAEDIEQTPESTVLTSKSQPSTSRSRKRGRGRPKNTSRGSTRTDSRLVDTASQLSSQSQAGEPADIDMADQPTMGPEAQQISESSLSQHERSKMSSDQAVQRALSSTWSEALPGSTPSIDQSSSKAKWTDEDGNRSGVTSSLSDTSIGGDDGFNLESHLQLALESLHQPQQGTRTNSFDFATVYNLCARIGLKAQELATSWRR